MAEILQSGKTIDFEWTAADMASGLFVAMKVFELSSGTPGTPIDTVAMTHRYGGLYTCSYTFDVTKRYGIHKMAYNSNSYTDGDFNLSGYSPGTETIKPSNFENTLAAIQTALGTPVASIAGDIAALKSDLDSSVTAIESQITTFKSDLDTRIGNPVGASISADLAAVKSDMDSSFTATQGQISTFKTETDARIGNPVGVSISADIAAFKAETDTRIGNPAGASLSVDVAALKADLDARIGAPIGASISADLQAVKSDIDSSFTAVQNKLGTPAGASVSADIAAAKADLDSSITSVLTAISNFRIDLDARVGNPVGASISADIASFSSRVDTHQSTLVGLIGAPTVDLSTDIHNVKNQVWNEPLAGHQVAGTAGAYLFTAAQLTPVSVANAVWDSMLGSHTLPGSFGLGIGEIATDTDDIITDLLDSGHGLAAIISDINSQSLIIQGQNTTTQSQITALTPALAALQSAVLTDVDDTKAKIDTLSGIVSSNQSTILTNFNQVLSAIATVDGKVSSLHSGTTAAFVVPTRLVKPSSGSKNYQFDLRVYDVDGVPQDADATPTVKVTRLDMGTVIVNNLPMTHTGTGGYSFTFVITSSTDEAPLLVEVTFVQDSITKSLPQVTEITANEGDLTALQATCDAINTTVVDNNGLLTNGVFGLSALKTSDNNIVNLINVLSATMATVKSKTDNLPGIPASQADTQAVTTAVNTRPTLAQIQTILNNLESALAGPDNRNLTQVYNNQPDLTPIAKTADPRFAFLDATVSSRSTLTANQVWAAATRTLTGNALTAADVTAIWSFLATTAGGIPNSIGKLLTTQLDATVGSRATAAQVTALLSGVAQDSTVAALAAQLTSGFSGNQTLLNTLQTIINAVKAKTDTIPLNPATNTEVDSQAATTLATIAALQLIVNAIKAKTDNLPSNPATATAVAAIPTNPVLDNDVRLARLDQPISSRATPANLTPLATSAGLTALQSTLSGLITTVDGHVTSLPSLSQIQSLLASLATAAQLVAARDTILDAIDAPGTFPSAADIWAYATRSLTDTGDLATTTDLAPLARTTDIPAAVHQLTCRMSSVFNSGSGQHEIAAWAELDGQRLNDLQSLAIQVTDSSGGVLWSASSNTPGSLYRFTNPIAGSADSNYLVAITAVSASMGTINALQSYITVG